MTVPPYAAFPFKGSIVACIRRLVPKTGRPTRAGRGMSKSRSIAPVKKTAADLVPYETMCRAIAEAKKADEVMAIHDEARALRAAARVANNREAEADLHVIRRRAEYRLNEMMV